MNSIQVLHKYSCEITTVVSRNRDTKTRRGNRRFFLASLINPRWEYTAKNVSDDLDATIESAVYINFKKQ